MQRMKERSQRRTGASLLATLALLALTQAVGTAQLTPTSKPSGMGAGGVTLRPINYPTTGNVHTSGTASGTPGSSEPLEIVPAGRPAVRVPILMYHYIRNNPDPRDGVGANLSVTPVDFRAQMDWLARNGYHPIDLDDLRSYLFAHTTLPSKPVVITLDDGYRDLYTDAFPVLRAHQFKAVAYIVSGFLGRPSNVTPEQVVEMNASGVEIGSHTVSHVDLTKTPAGELRRQLDDSRAALEALVGHPVLDFCYPAGAVNPAVTQAVVAAGYQSATTTVASSNVHSAADRFTWTRVRVTGGEPLSEFVARLGSSEPAERLPNPPDVPVLATQPLRPPLKQPRFLGSAPPTVPISEALTP
jgi:peptidoglycan/xylan/chitin deacetylase (PgdA/CDA1 family)